MFFRAWLRDPRAWGVLVLLGLVASGVALFSPQLRAWHHFRLARRELERFHNPQAVDHIQICLRLWPEDADVLLLAARAARRARAYQDAERSLDKYQQIRGCDAAYAFEQLLLSVERRVDDAADLQCWHYVEDGHPDSSLILEALTRGYLRQYRLQEARACLNRWLEISPDNTLALCLEGRYYLDYLFSKNEGLSSYRRAAELDPELLEARLGLAVALLESNNYAEAAEHLAFALQQEPDNLSARVGLAECRNGMGEQAEAVQLVDDVLAERPQFAPALALRGRLALASGDSHQAEGWLRQALSLEPSNHNARYHLIMCLHNLGKEQEAQQQQQQLNQLEKDLERFNDIVTKEMLKRPRDPALHFTLGQLLLRGGHPEEGLRWLHSALHLDPQYAPAKRLLDEYYGKTSGRQHQQG